MSGLTLRRAGRKVARLLAAIDRACRGADWFWYDGPSRRAVRLIGRMMRLRGRMYR